MAHEISHESGKPEFIYNKANGRPWHQLGEPQEGYVTPTEAARKVFPWTVETRPLVTTDGIGVPGKKAVIRTDVNRVLGVVGRKHTLVQNADFASAVEGIFGPPKAVIDTAGSLGSGERTFLLAKLPEGFEVRRGDRIEQYFLAVNNHDGLGSIKLLRSSVRVVCANTMTCALKSASHIVAIRHTKNVRLAMDAASKILARSETYWSELRAYLSSLAEQSMTVSEFETFLKALIPDTKGEPTPQAENTRKRLTALFEGQDLIGADMDGGTTRWRAFNVVTQWLRTERPVRGKTNRIEADLFGDGLAGTMRQRAVELLALPSFS